MPRTGALCRSLRFAEGHFDVETACDLPGPDLMAKVDLLFTAILAFQGLSVPCGLLALGIMQREDSNFSSLPVGAWMASPAPVSLETAQWLTQSTFVASSLETGRIGYLEAGHDDEFAGAYSYELQGQPSGVNVDADTGMLTLVSALSPGIYNVDVVAANRGMPTRSARFPIRLDVREGVTANRTGSQILHKVYEVDSGIYGQPDGQDYTKVLLNIRRTIIADQEAAGEENLRARIYFRRGKAYDYTVNTWLAGLQYVAVTADPRYNPDGLRPRLRNIQKNFRFDSELAVLATGGATGFDLLHDKLKAFSPAIDDAEPGADRVRLRNAADAKLVTEGRWYLVGSYDQQVGGYPPNIRNFDYVHVLAVHGGEVILDRKLRHRHRADYFEESANPSSLGVARIIPLDMGPEGGRPSIANGRLTMRLTVEGIEFLRNPATDNGSNVVLYIAGALDASFEDCVLPHPVPTIVRHMRFLGGRIESSEPDKLISTLIFDQVEGGQIGGATGVDLLLIRNSRVTPFQVSPRHLRVLNSTIDGTTDTYYWYPVTFAYNGPVLSAEFESTTFTINPSNTDRRVMPAIQRPSVVVGDEAHWRGDTLVIPRSLPGFLDWQAWLFEGMVVYATANPRSWGVVSSLGSPGDGSAIWAVVDWRRGAKPLSGELAAGRGLDLWIDDRSKLTAPAAWNELSGGFMRQRLPRSFGAPIPAFPTYTWDGTSLR
jgi:hypothetical protein